MRFINDSRSFGGAETDSDHKLVLMKMKIEWSKMKKQETMEERIDITGLVDENKKVRYKELVEEAIEQMEQPQSSQERWNQICKITKEKAKEALGTKKKTRGIKDKELEEMATEKSKLQKDIESCTDKNVRKIKMQQKKMLKQKMSKRINEVKKIQLENELTQIESLKNDSTRYFAAMKELNRKRNQTIIVKDKNGKTAVTENEQIEIVTEYFKQMLAPDGSKNNYVTYTPKEMTNPFTGNEIAKAAAKLKNGKSAGPDSIELELIKHAPQSTYTQIAQIYNYIAKKGEDVIELKLGLLRPLPKPGKTKGPVENLRPIILLSVLRNVMTICLIERTWDRLKHHIPPDQSAYQPGRGTTEQVFTIKLLAEKAIISEDYTVHLLLLDMSKAFDTVNRKTLFEDLEDVLEEDELHLISILTNRPQIKVKIGKSMGEIFQTLVGIMQGDVLSAILFIFYLAKCLRRPIRTKSRGYLVQPKYADDITYAGISKRQIDELEIKVPARLNEYDLSANESKTEKYQIPKPPPPIPPPPSMATLLKHKADKPLWSELDWLINYKPEIKDKTPDWRNCKLLGSKLDTIKDIGRRKGLAIDSMRKKDHIYKSRRSISIQQKIRTFNAYSASVFLYNSELWTVTTAIEKQIDSFQRRLLRQAINIRWPKKITSEELYRRTKEEKWSRKIKRRRLNWLGHLMRMEKETPARKSLTEALTPAKKKRGKPPMTWLKVIEKDIQPVVTLNIHTDTAETITNKLINVTEDRKRWTQRIKDIMESNL